MEEGKKTFRFRTSDVVSTYLFAFAAGDFKQADGLFSNLKSEFMYRETYSAKVNISVPEIFSIHTEALKYFE
ncbi:hypothetical protein, partial [Salmonella enterica]|uniref:hypothetical protein n=1 Tax=Salmonella enterica TaxID=28901 RepID=UPI0020C3E997